MERGRAARTQVCRMRDLTALTSSSFLLAPFPSRETWGEENLVVAMWTNFGRSTSTTLSCSPGEVRAIVKQGTNHFLPSQFFVDFLSFFFLSFLLRTSFPRANPSHSVIIEALLSIEFLYRKFNTQHFTIIYGIMFVRAVRIIGSTKDFYFSFQYNCNSTSMRGHKHT